MSFKDSDALKKLRQKAETLANSEPEEIAALSPEEIHQLLHNLQVHQIELEIQNEELRESKDRLQLSRQKLQATRDHFFQLYHQSPASYVVVDKNGIVRQANQTYSTMVGVALDLIERRPLLNQIDPQDHTIYLSRFNAFFNQPEGKRLELRLACFGKESRYIAMEGRLIDWPELTKDNSDENELLVIISDISESKRAEQKLQQAKLLAEKANRAKSEFLSRMSHELRTPLNAVIGFAQLMQIDEKGLSKNHQSAISHIYESGSHLLHLINEILDISKIESGKLDMTIQEVPLVAILESSSILVQPLALNNDVTIECDWRDAPLIAADPMRIKQVMVNLLSNSVKYNKRGGRVTITHTKDTQNKRVRIHIRDTGIGIREEDQEKIFEPFERIAVRGNPIDGTGIGLTITKILVESMNGTIGFTSQFGEGSNFWVELPKADQEVLQSKQAVSSQIQSTSGEKGGKKPKVVLYIEDNPTNQIVMQQMIHHVIHCKLYIAPDAEEGITLTSEKQPDLILMDIELPGASGYEALETLKSDPLTKHIPVIAVTAHAMIEDVTKGKQSKFFDYVVKPIDMNHLERAITNALRK